MTLVPTILGTAVTMQASAYAAQPLRVPTHFKKGIQVKNMYITTIALRCYQYSVFRRLFSSKSFLFCSCKRLFSATSDSSLEKALSDFFYSWDGPT